MFTYTIVYDGFGNPNILRSDGTTFPPAPGNADFQAFLVWNAQQNSPLNYTSPLPFDLAATQSNAIASLTQQCQQQINAAFDHATRDMLNYLYADALTQSPPLTNRAAYCKGVAMWGVACLTVLQMALAQVQAATTADQINAVTLTLPTAPAVTLAGAMQIMQ